MEMGLEPELLQQTGHVFVFTQSLPPEGGLFGLTRVWEGDIPGLWTAWENRPIKRT